MSKFLCYIYRLMLFRYYKAFCQIFSVFQSKASKSDQLWPFFWKMM